MRLAATFQDYFAARAGDDGGNRNAKGYNATMDAKSPLGIAIKALSDVDGVMLSANTKKEVKLIHGLHNFGNTLPRPENKIGGFFGMGNKAFAGVVDHEDAFAQLTIKVPSHDEISTCTTSAELYALARKKPTGVLKTCKAFFPIPLLKTAIFMSDSKDSIELIFAGRLALQFFYDNLQDDDPILLDKTDIENHMGRFYRWCFGVHLGLIPSANFEIDPDDNDLKSLAKWYHRERVLGTYPTQNVSFQPQEALPPTAAETAPTGEGNVTLSNLSVLTATLARVVQDNTSSAEVHEKNV